MPLNPHRCLKFFMNGSNPILVWRSKYFSRKKNKGMLALVRWQRISSLICLLLNKYAVGIMSNLAVILWIASFLSQKTFFMPFMTCSQHSNSAHLDPNFISHYLKLTSDVTNASKPPFSKCKMGTHIEYPNFL